MVIDDFNVTDVAFAPDKTNPPLIVNSDAVLAGPITFECLEPVAGRNAKILQPFGGMKIEELTPCHALDRAESAHGPILEKRFSVMATKGPDQDPGYDVEGIPSSVTLPLGDRGSPIVFVKHPVALKCPHMRLADTCVFRFNNLCSGEVVLYRLLWGATLGPQDLHFPTPPFFVDTAAAPG